VKLLPASSIIRAVSSLTWSICRHSTKRTHPLPISYHKGTLHHCFERGWFWVIPFNNNPLSTNPIISVGLTIDPRRYPKPDISAEQEFNEFLNRYPSVTEQFKDAKAVRPWVSTGRLQYSSKQTVGHRYCLMSHASGFIDPLFSRGMFKTVEIIQALIDPLLEALNTDNFDDEAFLSVDRQQQKILNYNDDLVNCSFILGLTLTYGTPGSVCSVLALFWGGIPSDECYERLHPHWRRLLSCR